MKNTLWNALFSFPGVLVRWIFGNKSLMKFVFKGRFALNGLDDKLQTYLSDTNGYFIEIGGNDGITQSNTKRLELFLGWTGLLVEPSPFNFDRMKLTRAEKTHKYMAACVPFDFKDSEVSLTFADLMTVSDSLVTDLDDKEQHLEDAKRWIRSGAPHAFAAKALTLTAILEDCSAPRVIDFLSLDVEGAELAVLGGIDFLKYSFRFLLVESRSFDPVSDFLASHGYVMIDQLSHHDYLFARAA